MSAGNLNTEGNKKKNFPYQFKVLQLLSAISGGTGAGATEATLQLVLSAIQDGQDFEAKIVVDDNGNGTTYLEVRIWNPDTQTWETPLYYLPGSNTGVPASSLVAPIIYINNGAVLAQIYTELLSQGVKLTDITNELTTANVSLNNIDNELIDQGNTLDTIDADTSTLATPTAGVGTSMTRVTSAGPASVAAGKRRVTFFNAGNADSTVDGATFKKGEIVTFSADGLRDTLEEITYDALTSELLITTVG
jgi:hypothetical protein